MSGIKKVRAYGGTVWLGNEGIEMDKKIAGFIVHVKENCYGPFSSAEEAVNWLNTEGAHYGNPQTIELLYEPSHEYARQQRNAA